MQSGGTPQSSSHFNYITWEEMPQQIQKQINQPSHQHSKIIKFQNYPYQYVKIFYYNFIKLCLLSKQDAKGTLQKLIYILDSDQFVFYVPASMENACCSQWSVSKTKRVIYSLLMELEGDEYQGVQEMLYKNQQNQDLLLIFFISIIYQSQEGLDITELTTFQQTKQVLAQLLSMNIKEQQNKYTFIQTNMILYMFAQNQCYLISDCHIEQNLLNREQSTYSIQLEKSQICDSLSILKIQLHQNDLEILKEKSLHIQNLMDFEMTQRRYQKYSGNITFDKTQRISHTVENFQRQIALGNYTSKQINAKKNLSLKPRVSIEKSFRQSRQLIRMFEQAACTTPTQQSICDDKSQQDEYSYLDLSVTTLKKIEEKKQSKEIIEKENYSYKSKFENDSLINKWHKLSKLRKNTSTLVQSQFSTLFKEKQNLKQKTPKIIKQMSSRPDFRKVKCKRRRSQQKVENEQETFDCHLQKCINESLNAFQNNQEKIEHIQQKLATNLQERQTKKQVTSGVRQKSKYFISSQSKKMKVVDNIYSKHGYINNNISNQFTDSLILKELDNNFNQSIHNMKEKARYQRNQIKLRVVGEQFTSSINKQ